MRYIEIKIYTTHEGLDPLTSILMDMGIAGFAIEDAEDFQDLMNKKNSYDWDYVDESLFVLETVETNISFYLEESVENDELLLKLKEVVAQLKDDDTDFNRFGSLSLQSQVVDDADWKDNWKEYFKPAKITEHIVIKPTWENYAAASDEMIIELDPGMAFGTGTHPTTFLCVRLLEKFIEKNKDRVLDVGCGSGILSIAASLLGAKEITGVDIDPVAVEVSKENIELNHMTDQICIMEGDLTKGLDLRVEIVVANLMADLVMMLSKDVAAHLCGKGIYISSGILCEKKDLVAKSIEKSGFRILEILEEGEWCAIAASCSEEIK